MLHHYLLSGGFVNIFNVALSLLSGPHSAQICLIFEEFNEKQCLVFGTGVVRQNGVSNCIRNPV